MTQRLSSVAQLVLDCRTAVREALAKADAFRGWQALQQCDADGGLLTTLPYTDDTIAAFVAAHARDPEDVGALHHLAIARHARAWGWELQGDPRADREWETALEHWRALGASAAFWDGLKARLTACDSRTDPARLDAVRRDLLEQLLDVHVDFVRHYSEEGNAEGAMRHVEITRRARLAPRLRALLTEKVFAAMTGAAGASRGQASDDSVLAPLERFLGLFPDHLPALRLHADLCKQWVARLSYQTEWDTILQADARALPTAQRLAAQADLEQRDPLACAALVDLGAEFAQRGADRAYSLFTGKEYAALSAAERSELETALDLCIRWGRLNRTFPRHGAPGLVNLTFGLHNRAYYLQLRAQELLQTGSASATAVAEALAHYRQALAHTEEAISHLPEERMAKNIDIYRERVTYLESELQRLELFGEWEGPR